MKVLKSRLLLYIQIKKAIIYNLMKLITRTTNIKNHTPVPEITFPNTAIHQQPNKLSQEQKQTQHQLNQNHNNNNLHFLQIKIQSPANSANCMYDKSITTHLESNHVYDSVKTRLTNSHLADWKLLTLQQLRKKNHPSACRQLRKSCERSRGIYVSVSQSKRIQKSREKQQEKQQDQHRRNNNCPYFKCLSSLSKKSKLIDRLQFHLGNQQQKNYFC